MNWQAYGAVAVPVGVHRLRDIADISLVVFIVGSGLVWMLPVLPGAATGTLKVLRNVLRFAAAGGMALYGGNSSLARRRD